MLDPVGTPLAALATAEQCLRFAKLLCAKYRDYKAAESEINELILTLEYHSTKIEYQIEFLRKVWASLEERLQNLQNTLLHVLSHKLQYAMELVDAAIGQRDEHASLRSIKAKRGDVRKIKFAFTLKQCLQKTVEDLGKWHQMFDPSWFLISRVSKGLIDESLREFKDSRPSSVATLRDLRDAIVHGKQHDDTHQKIFMSQDLVSDQQSLINDSSLRLAKLESGIEIIVDTYIPNERASFVQVKKEIRQLGRTLSGADPVLFGLLRCLGVVEHSRTSVTSTRGQTTSGITNSCRIDQVSISHTGAANPLRSNGQTATRFDLIFAIPLNLHNPQSLRSRLVSGSIPSLNARLFLAQSLVNAVMFVHSSSFVHKNIRPETVLLFESALSDDVTSLSTLKAQKTHIESGVGVPFLMGFEKFRLADGQTFLAGDANWEKDLYRHPLRQGLWPESEYSMQHDIYSLGVVLLEVGLWTSFVINGSGVPGPMLEILRFLEEKKNLRKRADQIKQALVDLAGRQLPLAMGHKYADIVISCLTCLDIIDPGLGDPDEFIDDDGISIGVRYIEMVIVKIQEISI